MRLKFNVRRFVMQAMTMVSCMLGPAQAMTPGSDKATWDPASIPQLTSKQAQALKAAKCRVVSYRNMDVSNPTTNTSGKPDSGDAVMLASGEFAKLGQKDLLALCQSEEDNAEFFFVVWGGPVQCESTLMMSGASRYWKTRGTLDYYGSDLQVLPPADSRKLLERTVGEPRHRESEMGEENMWVLNKQKWPSFNHDAFALFGNYNLAFYCNGKEWALLYDAYSTEID